MKTFVAKKETVEPRWYLIDAEGQVLGRLAVQIADILRGKNKPVFTPHVDCGDFVVVINASKVAVTGRKADQKLYTRYSGYPGGLKAATFHEVIAKHPERVIMHAVKGMLTKNSLGAKQLTKLKVYPGTEHPHKAQNPEQLTFSTGKK